MSRALITIPVVVYCLIGSLSAVAPAIAKEGTKCTRKCDAKWQDCKKNKKWFCARQPPFPSDTAAMPTNVLALMSESDALMTAETDALGARFSVRS